MADHSLTLGGLLLTESLPDDDHHFVFNVLAEGLSFGVAEGVREVIASLLADGDLVRTTRFGNRQVTFAVEIGGPDLASLAHGEAALRREVGRGNTLTWEAPMFAAATVFEVIDSSMSQTFDDLDDLAKRRTFEVTLTCAPFARSKDPVTVEAIEAAASTPTVIDDCSSAVNWTAIVDGYSSTPTAAGGAISAEDATSPKKVELSRTGTIVFGSERYLIVEVLTNAVRMSAYGLVSGVATRFPLIASRLLPSGWLQFVYDAEGATSVGVTFVVEGPVYGSPDAVTRLEIGQVSKALTPPQTSSRQLSRVIETGGTERTPASIQVASPVPASGLGTVLVHTCPETGTGYSPPLRRWRTLGNTVTADANTYSGAREPIHPNPFRAEVPSSSLPPGGYALVAMMKSDTAGIFDINWSADTYATFGAGNPVGGTTSVQFFLAGVWHFMPLALLTLPTTATVGSAETWIDIRRADSSTANVDLDEAWIFRADDDCALTVCGDTPQHLFLDSPGVGSPVPRVWWSETADRADARHPGASLFQGGVHVLHPDGTAVFAATSAVDLPEVSAEFYRRWHSNAAE